jgi:hypothetical protein
MSEKDKKQGMDKPTQPSTGQQTKVPDDSVDILLEVLDLIPIPVTLYTSDLRLWNCNSVAKEVPWYPEGSRVRGSYLIDTNRYFAERGDFGEGDPAQLAEDRIRPIMDQDYHFRDLELPNGVAARSSWYTLSDGSKLNLTIDMTDTVRRED